MNKIVTDLKILKQKSINIDNPKLAFDIIEELEETLKGLKGIGLTAIQIGYALKVGIIRIPGKESIDLINPRIIEKNEKFRHQKEGCLSIPGLWIDTIRYKDITIENNGEIFSVYGVEAVAIQHEIDHMSGLTILDKKWRKRR